MVKTFWLVVLLLSSNLVHADDYSHASELFFVNQAGGVVALTLEPCTLIEAHGFEHRSYATEANGTKHEGCWTAPDISDAPDSPEIRIIPIVNVWYDGLITPFPQRLFKPLDKQAGAV